MSGAVAGQITPPRPRTARTGGMIGSVDQLLCEAANDAISDGTEKITKAHLETVILDIAARASAI